jgi:hypothetical protein
MEGTKSVVRILAEHKKGAVTGSGFVIKNDGTEVLIATNDHVVEDNPKRIAVWIGQDELVDAEIVFTTSEKDLCVLRIVHLFQMPPHLRHMGRTDVGAVGVAGNHVGKPPLQDPSGGLLGMGTQTAQNTSFVELDDLSFVEPAHGHFRGTLDGFVSLRMGDNGDKTLLANGSEAFFHKFRCFIKIKFRQQIPTAGQRQQSLLF